VAGAVDAEPIPGAGAADAVDATDAAEAEYQGGEVSLASLVAYLDEFLEARKGGDYCPNGLQVEGRQAVRKVVTGVSACAELFARARARGADAVLVHHGLFWRGQPMTLTGFRYRRVAELVESGMSLIAYHLPLDRNPEVGNNALAASAFGLEEIEPFGVYEGLPIGCRGKFAAPVPASRLVELCRKVFYQEPLAYLDGKDLVTSVGIISGGAQSEVYAAIDAGLDAYITGEVSEWVMNVVREAGIHYLAAGHYATERLGVRALGDHVRQRFDIEVEFIDVPNPV
jgi:dinuclear metal center YbgI/SA1388 family protein